MTGHSKELLAALSKVTKKRSRAVIDHILKHGHVTTGELKDIYGYNHAARAPCDVREEGIPLETFFLKGTDGRRMAAYRFADASKIEGNKLGGRQVLSKAIRTNLYAKQNGCCMVCCQPYEGRYLQVDHRVPYKVAGDKVANHSSESVFMLLCGSCQRRKSWTCEHCENSVKQKDSEVCRSCYWAEPTAYTHVAMEPQRRADIVWDGREVADFERLRHAAKEHDRSVSEEIKAIVKKLLGK